MPILNSHDTVEFRGGSGAVVLDLGVLGNRIDLDADNDSSIRASADDTIQIEVAGTDLVTLTSTGASLASGTITMADGGTVTQATDKSTGVTLSTNSGQITMNGAALAAAADVVFTVTNTQVSATDVVIVNHGSAGTSGAYIVGVGAVGAGSFDIVVTNVSGGSLSQAIVINFVVIGGAAS